MPDSTLSKCTPAEIAAGKAFFDLVDGWEEWEDLPDWKKLWVIDDAMVVVNAYIEADSEDR